MQTKKQKMSRVAAFFRYIFKDDVIKPKISEALEVLQLTTKEKGLLSNRKFENIRLLKNLMK